MVRTSINLKIDLSILIVFFLGVALIANFTNPGTSSPRLGDTPTLLPPKSIKYFSLGYDEITADVLWLRTIQDFDYCENRPPGENDPSKFKCDRGWVFHMIDAVVELAPRFWTAYYGGALMLTVIVNDFRGASIIFDKGVAQFPTDWPMLYMASYHALHEEHDYPKASRLLSEAGHNGAPQWVLSLSARLREKTGELEMARTIMVNAIEHSTDDRQTDYFKKRLAEIDKQIADEQAKQAH